MKAVKKKITPLSPHEFEPKVSVNSGTFVYIQPQAMRDLQTIIHLTNQEIGMLGLVRKHENNIFEIYEMILPKQRISSATCELTTEGMGEVAEALIANRAEEYNNLRIWIHSHHSMGVSPSGQDDTQWRELAGNCDDYFMRGICNHKGKLKLDINLISEGISILDTPWSMIQTGEDNYDRWAAEFEEKCSAKTYAGASGYDWRDNRASRNAGAPTAHARRLYNKGWRTNPACVVAKNSLMRKDTIGWQYKTVSPFIFEDVETLELDTTAGTIQTVAAANQDAMAYMADGWEDDPCSNHRLRLKLQNGDYMYKEVSAQVCQIVEELRADWDDYLNDDDVEDVAAQNIADAQEQNLLPGLDGFQADDDVYLSDDNKPPIGEELYD